MWQAFGSGPTLRSGRSGGLGSFIPGGVPDGKVKGEVNQMKIRVLSILCFVGVSVYSVAAHAFDHTHSAWGGILSQYHISDGRVHYKRFKADLEAGKAGQMPGYLAELSRVPLSEYQGWSEAQRLAFLINAYNAFTVKLIVDNYPVKSIRKIGGLFSNPWKKEFFSLLSGKIKTLDAMEHEYLRKQFKAPEVHAAINCASFSCPKLQREPFVPAKVEAQLESAFKEFLADSSRNRYEPADGKLWLSEIFKWFGGDFDAKYGGYLKAIERLGPADAKKAIQAGAKVEWISYDWSLNDADPAK